jgi:hypothetical protein
MQESFKIPSATFPTLTGSIVTFNSQYAGLPLKSCVSQISGYQQGSGVPSPNNEMPLHAFSSASLGVNTINQWDEQWEVGYINETTGQVQAGYKFISKNFIPCLPNTQYRKLGTLGVAPAYYGWLLFYYYDENHNFIGHDSQWTADGVFTTPANCHFMKFRSYSNCSSYGNDISINHPSSDENYHAFNGAILTFGTTVYQGTIDFTTGVLTANYGIVDMGSLSWVLLDTSGSISRYRSDYITDMAIKAARTMPLVCEKFATNIGGGAYDDNTIYNVGDRNTVVVASSAYIDLTSFQTDMNGVMLAYELATPQTIQLTAQQIETLLGENNIWADTGETTLQYPKFG